MHLWQQLSLDHLCTSGHCNTSLFFLQNIFTIFKSSHNILGHSRALTTFFKPCVCFWLYTSGHCLAGRQIFSQVAVLLQTPSDFTPGLLCILLYSFHPLSSQAVETVEPSSIWLQSLSHVFWKTLAETFFPLPLSHKAFVWCLTQATVSLSHPSL